MERRRSRAAKDSLFKTTDANRIKNGAVQDILHGWYATGRTGSATSQRKTDGVQRASLT